MLQTPVKVFKLDSENYKVLTYEPKGCRGGGFTLLTLCTPSPQYFLLGRLDTNSGKPKGLPPRHPKPMETDKETERN